MNVEVAFLLIWSAPGGAYAWWLLRRTRKHEGIDPGHIP